MRTSIIVVGLATAASAFQSSSTPLSRQTSALSSAADDAALPVNPAIKIAANGMSLLKPIFAAEASLQSAVLGAIGGVDKQAVAAEIEALKKENKVLIYTYGLSPFSTEAMALLDSTGYEYKNVKLGEEWFLLGGEGSETRVALSRELESGATSLPKIFIGGKCIGGYSELAALAESGELDSTLKSAKAKKIGGSSDKPNFFTNLFA